ncbi:hypothetical protein N8Y93_04225, partial [Litorivicinus sp.]|nr:hypothetical protein [Litorivicinus sp.]
KQLIDQLWSVFVEAFPEHIAVKRGTKPKADNKTQFKVLILDLYVSYLEDPLQWIGMPQSPNQFKSVASRYNALHISSILITYRKQLHALDWIDYKGGSHSDENPQWNFVSRLRASAWLQDQFSSLTVTADDIGYAPNRECIVLNEKDYDGDKTFPIEYTDTDTTRRMRDILSSYNSLLERTYIDIATLNEPVIWREVRTRHGRRQLPVRISQNSKFVRRIFSRGDWNLHGRLYGGFWQQVSETLRKDIFINGNPTIEVDYKALHVTLLYAQFLNEQKIWPYGEDPYDLKIQLSRSVPRDIQRKRVKSIILQAINANSRKAAFSAFRDNAKAGTPEKRLTNKYLERLLEAFLDEHPDLRRFIATDTGVDLMRVDGDITEEIIRLMTKRGIPVLTIHDSYIVERHRFADLRAVMATAAIHGAGYDLFAEQENIEVDREDGYGMVLNERVLRELETPNQHSGYDKRLQKWLTNRKLKLTASSSWGGLMSTPVFELNPIYLPHS